MSSHSLVYLERYFTLQAFTSTLPVFNDSLPISNKSDPRDTQQVWFILSILRASLELQLQILTHKLKNL